MTKQFQIADLSETDKKETRKHIEWLRDNGAVSLVARLPFLGQVTINVSGTIYKSTHE